MVQLYLISRKTGISELLLAVLDNQPGFTVEGSGRDPKRALFVWPVNSVSDAMRLVDRKLSAINPDWTLHLPVSG